MPHLNEDIKELHFHHYLCLSSLLQEKNYRKTHLQLPLFWPQLFQLWQEFDLCDGSCQDPVWCCKIDINLDIFILSTLSPSSSSSFHSRTDGGKKTIQLKKQIKFWYLNSRWLWIVGGWVVSMTILYSVHCPWCEFESATNHPGFFSQCM